MKKDKYAKKGEKAVISSGFKTVKRSHKKKVEEDVAHQAIVGTQSVSEGTRIKDNPAHNTSTDNSNNISSNNIELGTNTEEEGFSTHTTSSEEVAVPTAVPQAVISSTFKVSDPPVGTPVGTPATLLVEELLTAVNDIKANMATKEFVDTMVGDSILAYHNKIFPPATGTGTPTATGTQEFTSTVANGPMQPTGTPPDNTNQVGNKDSKSSLGGLHDIMQIVVDGAKVFKEIITPPQDPQVYAIGKMGLDATEHIMQGVVKSSLKKAISEGFTPPHMEADH